MVAPALIPKRAGERIKTNRRDAVTLARLHRAGELTGVWAPDPAHEAVRDLVRAREAAGDDLRRKRQQLLSFLLRHSRIYSGGGHWTLAHRRWLAGQKFEHAAQQIVFQEGIDTIEDALQRLRRLEKQLSLIVPEWSMAPVVEAYQAMRGASWPSRPRPTSAPNRLVWLDHAVLARIVRADSRVVSLAKAPSDSLTLTTKLGPPVPLPPGKGGER